MLCFSACFSALAAPVLITPGEVRGALGGSVSVPCQYREGYQTYKKYWCRGAGWSTCSKVAETAGMEAEVKSGRVSIRDNHTLSTFTVTMGNLTLEDPGTYWCGINKGGNDPTSLVNITVLPDAKGKSLFCSASVPFLLCIVCSGIWMNMRDKRSSREMQPADVVRTATNFQTVG
ncbi:CMRF35-like molecule 3 [Carettochelys insculpta]|uniref:CMRF35-like molecule 3 n=1 Tax=Carettochelys insculpta TaxID=44489 RepID=UPI003EB7F0C3